MTATQGESQPFEEATLAGALTAAVWLSCVAVGAVGLWLQYERPTVVVEKKLAVIEAQSLQVELSNDPEPSQLAPPNVLAPPPAVMKEMTAPPAAALIPVAAPSPAIAFELPVAGPTRIVEAREAAFSRPEKAVATEGVVSAQPPVRALTYGTGEGKQAAPTYPPRALSEGQEGIVRVQFTVGFDGKVIAAELSAGSPWPLLNEAALKVIRERWRFAGGALRRYEVPINFKLRR